MRSMGRKKKKKKQSSYFNYFSYNNNLSYTKKDSRINYSASFCSSEQVRDIAEEVFGNRYTYRANHYG